MKQQIQANHFNAHLSGELPKTLAGDFAAAAVSATLVSPVVTAIDRAVVENAASSKHPLLSTLKSHILRSFRHPRLFFATKPFFYVWTLYAATYTTANTVESVVEAVANRVDQVFVSSITFLSTCIVNVPLEVWKDVRFVQLYGRPSSVPTQALVAKAAATATQRPHTHSTRVPRIVGATFVFRDAITIFGSINLPPMLSPFLSDSYFTNQSIKMAVLQFSVPILSQVVATPVHLLAMDFYNYPQKEGGVPRVARMRRSLAPTTAMRCSRIVPAFGLGLVANTGLRNYFHEIAGVAEPE